MRKARYIEKMINPVTNIVVLMTSLFYVAEWRLKKGVSYQPNELNTTLQQYSPLSQDPLNTKDKQTPGLLGTIA